MNLLDDDATAAPKDRRPSIGGAPRAAAIIRRHGLREPFVHQANGLAAMLRSFETPEHQGGFQLLHDMGCGKTLTTICALLHLYAEGRAETMFVACPTSVIDAWERECRELNARTAAAGASRPAVRFLGLTHTGSAKREAALSRALLERAARADIGEADCPLIVAMNYESTWRIEPALRAARFDMSVCDESQKIKDATSKQSLSMHSVANGASIRSVGAKFKVNMTGTPVPEGGLDWFGQMRHVAPAILGVGWGNFKAKYATQILIGSGAKQFPKVSLNPYMADDLERHVMPLSHRVSKAEAVDLPPVTDTVIEFDLSAKTRKIYDDLVRDSIAMIEREGYDSIPGFDENQIGEVLGDNPLTRLLRAQQITGGYMQLLGDDTVTPCDTKNNAKLKVLAELMETLRDTGKKLVVFHRFSHEGAAIADLAKRMSPGRPVSVINGSIDTDGRRRAIDDFQLGESHFFIGQIQAAAEGITLHAASDAAFYSTSHSAALHQQAKARIDRIGQTSPVTNHNLIARATVDVSIFRSHQMKAENAFELTDGAWGRFLNGA